MIRVFYLPVDPEGQANGDVLIYKVHDAAAHGGIVVQNSWGVRIGSGGTVCTYGEPESESPHETENLVPWHRVLEVEYS